MLNKAITTKISAILLAVTLLIPLTLCYADGRERHEDRHYYHYHEHPSFGLRLSFVPDDAFIVGVGGGRYYYYDGLFYNKMGTEYVLVAPPIGAVVAAIPPEYRPVVINGVTYYTDNGIYYVYTRYGYQVVPQPVTVVQAVPVVVQPVPVVAPVLDPVIVPAETMPPQVAVAAPAQPALTVTTPATDESFTVNIPNNKGGYTAVLIKRSVAGFVGPQGEFYSEFPKVTQLQAMYGK